MYLVALSVELVFFIILFKTIPPFIVSNHFQVVCLSNKTCYDIVLSVINKHKDSNRSYYITIKNLIRITVK